MAATDSASAQSPTSYPWCSRSGRGSANNCYYVSKEQCQRTISGIGAFCFKGPALALFVVSDLLMMDNALRINTLALGARLSTMHSRREQVEAGCMKARHSGLELRRRRRVSAAWRAENRAH